MKKIILNLIIGFTAFGWVVANAASTTTVTKSTHTNTTKPQPVVESLNSVVAVVNSQIITQNQLNKQVSIIKHQLQLANQPVPSNAILTKKVLDQLINEKLILQMASTHKIKVSNTQLNSAIGHIAAKNHLTVKQLKQKIKKQGINYQAYRKQIHKQLVMNATERAAVGSQIQVTKSDVEKAMKQAANQLQNVPEYNLEAMLIPVTEAPSPAELAAARSKAESIIAQLQGGESFSTIALTETFKGQPLKGGDMGWRQLTQLPPVMAGRLAGAITGSIVGPIQTPRGYFILKVKGTRTLNATHQVKLTHLRIILLKPTDTETGDALKTKLNTIRTKILKGASFAKMAEKYSQDPHTAQKGGDLGWIAANEIPAKLEQAIKNLKKGQISKPINTRDGWQIVQVEGYKTVNNSKQNLKAKIKQMIYIQKFETAVKNWVKKLRANAFIKIMSS